MLTDLLLATGDSLTSGTLIAGNGVPQYEPEQPPGLQNLSVILGWIAWGVTILCLAAFLICAGWLAIATLTGQEVRAAKGLVIVLIAAVIVGAASAIFAAFV